MYLRKTSYITVVLVVINTTDLANVKFASESKKWEGSYSRWVIEPELLSQILAVCCNHKKLCLATQC